MFFFSFIKFLFSKYYKFYDILEQNKDKLLLLNLIFLFFINLNDFFF